MSMRHLALAAAVMSLTASATAQSMGARERAGRPYETGLEQMRGEDLDGAVSSFRQAIIIDPEFEMAHYMLGRVYLMQRNYASAVVALEKARDVFTAQATQRFTSNQEAQRLRRERINDMTHVINQLQQARQTPQVQEQIRQFTERRRQLQDLDRNQGLTQEQAVPGFVSLSLGSAYFRAGRMAEAERAYLAAVTADPKIGEAHNNLAVIYMETGRLDAALRAVEAAERAGLRVNPALKEEIRKRRKAGSEDHGLRLRLG
jgi:tetratricopeptide (TPR) repeat protein